MKHSFCIKCGERALQDANFCHSCGSQLSSSLSAGFPPPENERTTTPRNSAFQAQSPDRNPNQVGALATTSSSESNDELKSGDGHSKWVMAIAAASVVGFLFGLLMAAGLDDGHSHRVHWLAGLALMLGGSYGLAILFSICSGLLVGLFSYDRFVGKKP